MKIDRLMGIVVYLLNHGRTPAQKLAKEFEVSARTILRDMESLGQAGFPIQSFCGAQGGYQLIDSFVMDKQAVTRREYDWIITALKGLASAYAGRDLQQTLAKLQSLHTPGHTAFSVDLSAAREDKTINSLLVLLEHAIEKRRVVQFSYTNSQDEVKEIQAEPVSLQYKWYNWYLVGYYEKYQDCCMFKLMRMEHLRIADKTSQHTQAIPSLKTKEKKEAVVHIKLIGKAVIKAKCREYLNGEITREFENGDFEFCFSAPAQETFWFGALLSLGNRVTVLEPPELKERILKICKEIQEIYEV